MEIFNIKNLTFKYSGAVENTLENINLKVKKGDFVLICGKSGCGKTTLLKMLKPEITPAGERTGTILYNNNDLYSSSEREIASKIGFVVQNPENQIVTDKVWHELSFGLQNLGMDKKQISRRIAEMSSYFGIEKWIDKNTFELSGGQKQILNLASVMAMNPEILILDEPTSQLDPISANEFIKTLKRINEEQNVTIIIVEHRLEELFCIASKVVLMDKKTIKQVASPRELCESDIEIIKSFLPIPVRLFKDLKKTGNCPITIKEGRDFLEENFKKSTFENNIKLLDNVLIELKNICFRYDKNSPDILKNLDLKVNNNEILSVLGGNAQGKTTLLKVFSSIYKQYRGKITIKDNLKVSYLTQNPVEVFLKDTVRADFEDISNDYETLAEKFSISHLLDRHPFDLSCGEQQKCAIVKLLLTKPKIILLDEPTKGLDNNSKRLLKEILLKLKKEGITIILATHDTEFSSEISDRCALLFNGQIVCVEESKNFFSGNIFYTTVSSKISRDVFKNVVTYDDLLKMCRVAYEKEYN